MANSYLNTNIMFVKADEVEEVLSGADEKYKAISLAGGTGNDHAAANRLVAFNLSSTTVVEKYI